MNKDSISELPRARKENLIIKQVDGEMLVYDLTNDKAHCLNQTAARIWQYCDGSRSVAEIAELISTPGDIPVADAVVLLALDQLQKFALLETKDQPIFKLAGMNRRELVRRVGLGALALPIILSITSPAAAQAGSAGGFRHCCNSPGDCTPPFTCQQDPVGCFTPPPPAPSTKSCQ